MMTPYEQAIIEKVKKQGEANIQLMHYPPHEQDNIPSLFSCLTDEEFNHFVENRDRLMPHLDYLNERICNLGKEQK